ncbi:hypothetical protein TIFTF001_044771 [Ficus carica]|uniref:Uncharacterized protein n=1 Tax=Ficus carica TaxID=3494 RepID=A0AA87Z3U2_FICCA|nr:hypothetical protein TIFTF001_044200 [Ficus carica]GMN28157.1 hypothetical protein TIFTF001_044204 [Ficus carica]GMN33211.1 hypothetical protein TIFTF001_044768 [Ficus carica]GMN33225.1 hypothetical protein TIFTF001_044771 [Ficus carica]
MIRLKAVAIRLVACKREAPRSKGDTSVVSAKGTPILKSVITLMNKQRSKVLARKNCPYLNGRDNPLFIGVPYGFGYSGDPDGLYSEWSRRVDMFRAYGHRTSIRQLPRAPPTAKAGAKTGTRTCTVTYSGCQVSDDAGGGCGVLCHGTVVSRYMTTWQGQYGAESTG